MAGMRWRWVGLAAILAMAVGCGSTASSEIDSLMADIGFSIDTTPDAIDDADDALAPRHDAESDSPIGDGANDATETGPDATDDATPDAAPDTPAEAEAEPEVVLPCECGDGACGGTGCGETAYDCPEDCCVCGDGKCQPAACGESPDACHVDCALWVCGNGLCEPGEAVENCAEDCGEGLCGNGACEEGEDALSCTSDCGLDCPPCHDADPCTKDQCDPFTGTCVFPLVTPSGGPDATCDGVDDDCDGAADEDYDATPTACGTGACAAAGLLTCVEGQLVDTCAPLPASPESCNGVDDDCNGPVDDGIAVTPTACGVGACAAVGELTCVDGLPVDSCAALPPGTEACNGADDDCDGQVDEACPCPVQVYGGHAYEFCTEVGRWTVARDACAAHGGYHLATVSDAAENAWLTATAAAYSGDPWWIGASDRDDEGTFTWVDGSPVGWAPWADGEPNDSWWNEDCVDLLIDGGGAWNDENCQEFLNFVCEHE